MSNSTPPIGTLVSKLELERRVLLDLTARNRLLNTPRNKSRSKTLEIVDELSDEVFRILVTEQRTMSFIPAPEQMEGSIEEDADVATFGQPEEDEVGPRGVSTRHSDTSLQTRLVDKALQKRLLGLCYDARTAEEEQGVNILYLALGFLKWYEADRSDVARYTPLILVPCELTRNNAGGRIHIRAREDDITTNLSLQARVQADLGILIPQLPDPEDLVPSAYFAELRRAVEGRPRWEVLDNDIVLGFFSFSKFLMYRDLDAGHWGPRGGNGVHPVLDGLLGAGFQTEEPLWPENDRIDEHVGPQDMVHVMDADSSQIEAIEEVKASRNLVIQGPPGTGKSQTIANLIAAAVVRGKRVLFVAEKMAALEVVRARLNGLGLGSMCLELHSRKANKRQVLAELDATLQLDKPRPPDLEDHVRRLRDSITALNGHADALHSMLEPAGITPYRVLGEIVRHLHRGTTVPEFELTAGLNWSRREFEDRRQLVQGLCTRLADRVPPAAHAWRGADLQAVLPTDLPRLQTKVDALVSRVQATRETSNQLADRLGLPAPVTLAEIDHLAGLGCILSAAPEVDFATLATAAWKTSRRQLRQLVELGSDYSALASAVNGVFRAEAWDWDPRGTRDLVQKHGRSWFRCLRGNYRRAEAEIKRMSKSVPRSIEGRVRALEELEKARLLAKQIASHEALGSSGFGRLWDGVRSNWPDLTKVLDWVQANESTFASDSLTELLARVTDRAQTTRDCEHLGQTATEMTAAVHAIVQATQLDLRVALGKNELRAVSLSDLDSRASQWSEQVGQLVDWVPIALGLRHLRQMGLPDLADRLYSGTTSPGILASQFDLAYYEAWMREAMRRHPQLSMFDGRSHAEVVGAFRRLDAERIRLARAEVALAHWRGLPKGSGSAGELATVMREIKKKKRHLPIRRLLDEAGTAIQSIKPVFMMSPLSIAQFLSPRRLEFDLLLIDEASQVQPVDAFGAVLRSRQIVVVGDEKQLPPTSFFDRMEGDDENEDTETVSDVESILGLCSAQGIRQRMLQWHYRSQHQSLIAVSNQQFYNNKLYVFPSPFAQSDALGLKFHRVADGVYDRGGKSANQVEAQRVAMAAIEHARKRPGESLGIGTFSMAQRDAILDELERAWRTEPDVREFFAATKQDPFFVKNLENIQGDERDVIYVSVGYGKDAAGYFGMNFGPVGREGGERRLNVLITRARKRCEVFSSIQAADIDLNRAHSRGAAALKEFLAYAESGTFGVGVPSGEGHDSPFEEEVAHELRALGYEIVPQIGVAGFRVDLAVVDPTQRGRYLLGIECDGATYHSSRSARDRDRLRQEVLESRGWTIHRIWSTDWFKNREEQKRQAVAAIEQARLRTVAPSPEAVSPARLDDAQRGTPPPLALAPATIEREAAAEEEGGAADGFATLVPYEVASFPVSIAGQIHEVSVEQLVPVVRDIVEIEGPIHRDEVARRVTTLWGLRRAGGRIQAQVGAALDAAVASYLLIEPHTGFVDRPEPRPVRVRDRGAATPGLKCVETWPPSEIQTAIRHYVRENVGVGRDELARLVARAFGFKATSADMVAAVQRELATLRKQGLVERDGKIFEPAM